MPDWPPFVELINSHQRFLLTTHVRPDGDAVGSELAMAAALRQLGKDVTIVNAQPCPPKLRFLDPNKTLLALGQDVAAKDLDRFDALMSLDTAACNQLGQMADVVRTTSAEKIVLDHHVIHDDPDAQMFKDPKAEATGRLVIEAADQLGVSLTPEMARAAFVALVMDTGWFRFSSTTGDTLRLAARLIEAGAAPDQIYCALYENDTLQRLQLVGRVMGRVEMELDGRLIHTHLSQADFQATGAHASDAEDMINLTLAVGGTEAAVLLVEMPDGRFKASFRSRSDLDCTTVAEQFGGGGHKKAAGATVDGPLENARTKVLDAMRQAMQ